MTLVLITPGQVHRLLLGGPVGGGIGKLARFGNQPVDFKLQAFSNVESPDGGPEWSMMFAMKFLFPK